ncbi:hypothetical protein ATM97_23560 [Nocardia sp. MH4]|uniref:hypothetical protein n=1 Tax=Nocardia sp. MH4 TaxID=1768677 RepID=UPI001C4F744D|nr:hypothetical protein [Nocardia sp. MH4]MBW0273065.1 hypothetical protein [Nocardia sp. MH4]
MKTNVSITTLVDVVAGLDPRPRERQWVSLTFCVLDAVYSIGANYIYHVVPVVERVAATFGVDVPATAPAAAALTADPVPLGALLGRYPDSDALVAVTKNRQNTSTRGGIRKADAVLRYARILDRHGVNTLADARAALSNDQKFEQINHALRRVPGEGAAGVRRGYLWMLIGDQWTVKPDRIVLRWLSRAGFPVDEKGARRLLREVAESLTDRLGRDISPWEVDHAIWRAGRPT